jgi:uncharacterized protein YaaQ
MRASTEFDARRLRHDGGFLTSGRGHFLEGLIDRLTAELERRLEDAQAVTELGPRVVHLSIETSVLTPEGWTE